MEVYDLINLEQIQKHLPSLEEIENLDQGGQKIVFKAKHKNHGTVVLKLILGASVNERISREIEIVTSNTFTNVPKLYEWGRISDGHSEFMYLIEQFIDGATLRNHLKEQRKLPLTTCLHLLESLLKFATELEVQKLVHRDIKPENIIIDTTGEFWVLDFGIARNLNQPSITDTRAHFGPHTAGYAAPEQFRNLKKEIDIKADLFSIGVVIYEALTGEHPFAKDARNPLEILYRTETIIPNIIIIPGDSERQLGGFISILIDKYPSRRPKSAKIALDWFKALLPTIRLQEE
jgi:serine/threonine-protein kinase